MAEKLHNYASEGQSYKILGFHCPGCGYGHAFTVGETGDDRPRWTWNGSYVIPTFNPSLLCNRDFPENRCHSFVKDGYIQFLSDCFHKLAGQTVKLPDWEE